MGMAEDVFGDAVGREITVLIADGDQRVIAGILMSIDGDTLMIHDHGPRPGANGPHACVPGMCVFPVEVTDVCESITGEQVAW